MHQRAMHPSPQATNLEIFGTCTTNGKTEGKNHTRERYEHRKRVDPPRNQNDTENNEIESKIDDSAAKVGEVSQRSDKVL